MTQLVQVAPGMNLYAMAAKYLGDATQWIRIAQTNGLADPYIYATGTLVIPNPDATLTGGIVQQQ